MNSLNFEQTHQVSSPGNSNLNMPLGTLQNCDREVSHICAITNCRNSSHPHAGLYKTYSAVAKTRLLYYEELWASAKCLLLEKSYWLHNCHAFLAAHHKHEKFQFVCKIHDCTERGLHQLHNDILLDMDNKKVMRRICYVCCKFIYFVLPLLCNFWAFGFLLWLSAVYQSWWCEALK